MEIALDKTPLNFTPLRWMLVSAVLSTLFLFFIDEGYYSFEWMAEWGAWVVFFVFVFAITVVQVIVAFLASLFLSETWTVWVSKGIAGLPLLGCAVVVLLLL